MRNTEKGFTLVEVLIVVVIIAILASLIVPRMLMQTDKAKAAEAIQMVGVIKRAAEMYYDFHGSYSPTGSDFWADAIPWDPAQNTPDEWAQLGLQLPAGKTWEYSYQTDGSSYNIFANGEGSFNDLMMYQSALDMYTCSAPLKDLSPDRSQGCTI